LSHTNCYVNKMNIFINKKRKELKVKKVKNKIVLFLDVLGFSDLTVENKLDIDAIKDAGGPIHKRINYIFTGNNIPNKLTETFASFHSTLEGGLNLTRLQCDFTSITFSDSAFIVTNNLNDAVTTINYLMQRFLICGVPVRAGIALGTFEAIRFKSDIKPESGEHASHFLGTGVVNACRAESCSIKGMRILIHPSIEKLFKKIPNNKSLLQDCDNTEINNSIGVKRELNYWDYNVTDEKTAWRMFQKMWKEAPEESKKHYLATANAIQKMRIAKGYNSIKNLNRVSILR